MKISTLSIIAMLIISNAIVLFTTPVIAGDDQPQWPINWIQADEDPIENAEKAFRDVHFAYYSLNYYYLYLRLECYGYPNFSAHPDDSRYKWFIDTDDPFNMVWIGGNVVEADYMLFVEDTNNDGNGEIYLLNDIDGDGSFNEWEPPNDWYDGIITDVNIANYSIIDKNIYLWLKLENISNPDYTYFTWSTDNENSNINQAPTNDRSDTFSADLSKADVSVEKLDSIDPVNTGESFSYILNVTNHGPHIALNVNVTDYLPTEVSFVNAVPAPNGISGSIYWWNFASLTVGESKQITINVTVNSSFTGTITNIAHVYNDTRDPIPGNNEDIEQTNVIYMADLSISKSANIETAYPGQYLMYTLNVTNNGPDTASNVIVYDILPNDFSFVSSNPEFSGNSDSIYWWSIGSLDVSQYQLIIINVTIDNIPGGTIITNIANVTSSTYDPILGNNYANEEINIGSNADLSLIKSHNITDFVYVGDQITYTLNIINNGPDTAENVIVYDNLPNDVLFTSSDPDFSGYTDSTYWWSFGSLSVDESKQIKINVTVNNVPAGTINNIANVTSNTYDPTPGNNGDSEQITMGSSADISIIKTADLDIVSPGGNLKYTIVITNNGPDAAENVSVLDIFSNKVTFKSSDPTPDGNSGSSYWWNYSSLGVNQSKVIKINVTVNKNATGKIINTANVTSTTHDPNPGDESNEDDEQTEIYKPPTGGGGGGSGSGGSGGATYQLPTADPNGPYYAFIGGEIEFNGTGSYDNDEGGASIVQYDWKFFDEGDWHTNLGAAPKYIYYEAGIYNVTLRVIDNEGSSSVNTTTVTIFQPNLPPTNIIITGEVKGHQNISYSYNISASDPDSGNIIYTVNWGDGSGDISNPISNGIIYTVDHIWTAPGDYAVTVYATDELGAQSDEVTINVLIDILYVKEIGYLIDYDSDGTYDKFFSNTTKKETVTEKLDDGRYLINDDDDDKWDWIYDPDTDTLEVYYYGEEADMTLWYILLFLILIFIITLILLLYKKKKKKETPLETITQP